jgi:hypothetical protein
MEILDGASVSETIFRRYSQNPNGWSYTIYPSKSNDFYDAIVASPDESWQLKLDTVFKPNPLVLGSKSELDLRRYAVSLPLSFGYREMSPAAVRDLGGQGMEAPGLAALLASLAPVVPEAGRAYAHGPFVLTGGERPIHDQAQARLDERLTSDMLKLMRTRYSSYG